MWFSYSEQRIYFDGFRPSAKVKVDPTNCSSCENNYNPVRFFLGDTEKASYTYPSRFALYT